MARDGQYRLLHASISTSRRIRNVKKKMVKGDKWWRIGTHLLYSWIIPVEDDDRRLPGDPLWILANVVRHEDLTVGEIEEMLAELHRVKLIIWYEVNGDKFIQTVEKRDMQRIRKDRSKESIYPPPPKELLEEALKEENEVNSNGSETAANPPPNDGEMSTTSPQVDNLSLSLSPSLSLSESPSLLSLRDSVQGFVDLYNSSCPNLNLCKFISKERKKKITLRLRERSDLNWWTRVFEIANEVELLPNEKHPNGWKPDLEFMVRNEENAIRIFEGKYSQRKTHKQAGAEALLKKTLEEDENEKTRESGFYNGACEAGGGSGRIAIGSPH